MDGPFSVAGKVSIADFFMFLETQRAEGVSTSDLILAIVKDYASGFVWQSSMLGIAVC